MRVREPNSGTDPITRFRTKVSLARDVTLPESDKGRHREAALVKILVIDDHPLVLEGIAAALEGFGYGVRMVAARTADKGLAAATEHPDLDLVLLDVALPGLNGLGLQQQLAGRTDMPIIFITGHGDVPMTVQAMKAGAVEFLTKPFKDDVLLEAIRSAIERSQAALRQHSQTRVLRDCYDSLTPRERQVMELVVSGLLNKQVGGELGISEITVKAHRGQVMRKMKADSLPDLVTMAARLGLRSAPRN